jgi:hypothetical protein
VPLAASPLRGCCPLPQAAPGCGAACLLANWPPQGRNQLCRSDKSNRYRFRKKLLSCGDSLTESNRRPSPYHLSTGRRCSHQRRRRPGRSAVGQLIWSSHAAPAARTPRPPAGALAAGSPGLRSRRPAAARAGAQWPAARAPRRWRRPRPGPGTGQARQPQARCGRLAYQPTVSPAGQRSPHGQRRGNQPSAPPHPASTAPSRQTRPRRPPDPAPAPSATCPGSTGSSR